jgi:hypothetical protein
MQFLVPISRVEPAPAQPPSAEDRERQSEIVRALYSVGVVRQIWLRGDGGACMIAESDRPERLAAKLTDLPLIKLGFVQMPRIIALKPYPGFGPRAGLP